MQSLDSKAIKLALGVPVHTKTSEAYKAAGILSLDDWRRLHCAKYIVRASAVENFTEKELYVQSDIDFPKRAHSTQCLQTIYSYTNEVFLETTLNPRHVSKQITATPIPSWELNRAKFDIFHTNLQKNDDINLLVEETRIHLHETYYNDMKIYTDGSVLENGDVGAGFVIPYLNIKESFFLGKGYSIFTAELTAILMALRRVLTLPNIPFSIAIFSDSKSALQAIQSNGDNERKEIIYEIKHTIHSLLLNKTMVCFCWIPSHCGFLHNEWADKTAKQGAKNLFSPSLSIYLSRPEMYHILRKHFKHKNPSRITFSDLSVFSWSIKTLAHRLALNAWKTKYCQDVTCICKERLSINHIIKDCNAMKTFIPNNLDEQDVQYWEKLAKNLIYSPIGRFL